jgi:hypothetical protein
MESDRIIESYGIITKEEMVCSLSSNILEGTLVLETLNPFPGYHGKNVPDPEKPRSLYLVLDKKYDFLRLGRILREIRLRSAKPCHAAFGKVDVRKTQFYCIRLRNLDCFQSISEIQKAITGYGIGMMKHHMINEEGIIHIHKPFLLKHLGANLYYKDEFDPNHYYFRISADLEWEKFKKITALVKSNIDQNIFDAAKVVLWTMEGPVDLVRIYEVHPSLERLNKIRNRYEFELSK